MVIDTNIVLRYLLQDNAELLGQATIIIESGESILLDDVVIMECIYVLVGVYKKTKNQSSTTMKLFSEMQQVTYTSGLAQQYLKIYSQTNLDLADCYLIALAIKSRQDLKTFDKQMLKIYRQIRAGDST